MPLTESEKRKLGVIIAEKYRVDKLIARGGFSSVYRGTQMGMGRPVAIKTLSLDQDVEATWLERFGREARLVSQLRHPNTITIFDFGKHQDDFLYIVMEYINGRSLSRQVRKYGHLSPDDVAFVATEILKSLDEAHARNILHRDLKPSNIMIARDHNDDLVVKVLDFGVAKMVEPDETDITLTAQGAFVGTPRYASPEQMRREEATIRSDIYGVGMVMWEALVGDPPVPDTEFSTAVEYHLGPKPWRLPPEVACPPALAHILYRALEKEPGDRYQSCSEMLADLRAMSARDQPAWDEPVPASLQEVFDSISEVEEVASEPEASSVEGSLEVDESDAWQPDSVFDPDTSTSHPSDASSIRSRVAAENREKMQALTSEDDLDFGWEDELTREHDEEAAAESDDEIVPELAFDPRTLAQTPEREVPEKNGDVRSAGENRGLILGIMAMIGLAVVVGGIGLALQGFGSEDDAAIVTAASSDSDETAELPLVPTEKLIAALRTAGWLTSGKIQTANLGGTTQTSMIVDYTRKEMVANVVIYECESDQLASELATATDSGAEVVKFGRTVVRISPGPSNKISGVTQVTQVLFTFRQMMQKKGLL